jgi:hypothetical protein
MTRLEDGRWQVRLTPPVGSLILYRYTRSAPTAVDEVSADGELIRYRTAHIPGSIQIDDIITAWQDTPYVGPSGRIIGNIRDAVSGEGLPEVMVSVAGANAITDGEGSFRIDGLTPGLHNMVVFALDGSYRTAQQGAVIAAESTTPVELSLQPATAVQVTFQLNAPADTIPGTPLRIAGNVAQLGNTFSQLPGGLNGSSSLMPSLTLVDPTHYITVITLYAGTDLRYKYTLGDGLWNAERDSNGFFLTRQLIVPDHDLVIEDSISSWHTKNQGSLRFFLHVPENTPSSDQISIQFNLSSWFDPIPMWRLDEDEWFFVLHGPLDISGTLGYRYCRNMQCGSADDVETPGIDAIGRPLTTAMANQDLMDEVIAWQWWDPPSDKTTIVAPNIQPREGFEAGVSFLPAFNPSWMPRAEVIMADVAQLGANALILTPTWILGDKNYTPEISYDPSHAPSEDQLRAIVQQARARDLQVSLQPVLTSGAGGIDAWWTHAERDSAWWNVWFDEYRSFILTYAKQAQAAGVTKLILGGPEIEPALPGGLLSDGSAANCPGDAETHWRSLVDEIHSTFGGTVAFEIELGEQGTKPPPFIDAFDEIHVYWHAPLSDQDDPSIGELQSAARQLFEESLFLDTHLGEKPIVLNVEYLSISGSASACAKAPDGSCRSPSDFDLGSVVDQDLTRDLDAQADTINAVLLEALNRTRVKGFYVRGYNPIAALQDKSASVLGKPAQDVLWYWYPRLTGQQD